MIELTKRQKDILSIIKEGTEVGRINGRINRTSSGEIISKLDISERTIFRELSILKQLGYIRRVGSKKTGYWEALDK